jgi:hypothetical protein
VEGDSDRAAYSEINRRLDSAGRGIDDCLFLNAQNWQTIPKLVGPLRDLGIPAAAIVDLDAIRSPQKWVSLFTAAGMDLALRDTFNARRDAARKILKTEPASRVKKEGLGAFSKKDRKFLEGYLEELAEYGIFVVPVGVLESWLKELEIPSGKSKWVAHLLERLGTDRDSPTWVEPEDSDVWAFIDRISRWVADPDRRGIPDQFSPSDADDGVQSLEDPEFR